MFDVTVILYIYIYGKDYNIFFQFQLIFVFYYFIYTHVTKSMKWIPLFHGLLLHISRLPQNGFHFTDSISKTIVLCKNWSAFIQFPLRIVHRGPLESKAAFNPWKHVLITNFLNFSNFDQIYPNFSDSLSKWYKYDKKFQYFGINLIKIFITDM